MDHNERIYQRLHELITNSVKVEDIVIYGSAAEEFRLSHVLEYEQAKYLQIRCLSKLFKLLEDDNV